MPKFPTFPTLFNEVLQISISNLKELGYLDPCQRRSGTFAWNSNGREIGSIGITADMTSAIPNIELDYKYRDQSRNYRINIIAVPSNIGKGKIYYFQCPQTGKRCRKLYSIGGYFLHRDAFRGCYYESQTRSRKMRMVDKVYGSYFKQDKLYEELYKPYFKPYYAGKPTKRYIRINKKLEEAERISAEDFERLLVGKKYISL